ncbi:lysine/arginine/ornithine ABC transporter substrate-binding protein [Haemophilus influenzae]|jgi:lysine-arginine-ornithine-binding periplasmic protein|uniref:lysine/arginine/ornithine ABC transporter substrate-binding protein n=1 Tax=Haemophilus TaxID=724 RepID=UPI0005D99619|nr:MULTISPECIES: lysine/arginine/ornithine ABC transporter substrate-binding protein [Haemophilus]AXP46561.1 arginine ABC transporter substrate-binding protein [Haemophilus influenzae]AXP60200.1 arginine ABC transporter substrate-binding protein [Haemophilus influenzae]AXP63699.1 arginine ABC transporter substrate-binding protein [Haemophilus influenzae]AXP65408.1 arginine ABC transporter substrate-binding protein [Haemophilus influenzae]KMZ34786.1 arginine ABC transporter substrate-binding pr
MKKTLLTAILLGSSIAVSAQELTFAMEPSYPPFETTNAKGEIIGFDVDVANAICQEIQVTCKFKSETFDSLIPSLKAKRFDAAISAIDITDARAKQVLFSDAYYDSSASYVALKGKATLESAKNIGVQNGTTFQQYTVAETKQYSPKSYASLQNAILDLKSGRIDIILGDTAVLSDMISKEPEIQFVGEKVTNKKYFGNGLGIAMHKSNKDLAAQLNKGLAAIKANGEYQKIYDKWMTK